LHRLLACFSKNDQDLIRTFWQKYIDNKKECFPFDIRLKVKDFPYYFLNDSDKITFFFNIFII